ncbi:putative serine hydrolase FSH, alpha/Beta hydrolase [Helianthus anomalus]
MESLETPKKPRILCLHGGVSNATLFKEELSIWPDYVLEKMDLVFINGPFPAYRDGIIVDEHFEWYAKDDETYGNFEEGIAYIEDCMVKLGPFDGVLGKSQGGIVTGLLPGLQEHSVYLTKVPKIEHVVIISGAKLGGRTFPGPKIAETAFSSPINIPSLHIFGENDFARETAPELAEAYVDPLVIYHHGGHEVPKLGIVFIFIF